MKALLVMTVTVMLGCGGKTVLPPECVDLLAVLGDLQASGAITAEQRAQTERQVHALVDGDLESAKTMCLQMMPRRRE